MGEVNQVLCYVLSHFLRKSQNFSKRSCCRQKKMQHVLCRTANTSNPKEGCFGHPRSRTVLKCDLSIWDHDTLGNEVAVTAEPLSPQQYRLSQCDFLSKPEEFFPVCNQHELPGPQAPCCYRTLPCCGLLPNKIILFFTKCLFFFFVSSGKWKVNISIHIICSKYIQKLTYFLQLQNTFIIIKSCHLMPINFLIYK